MQAKMLEAVFYRMTYFDERDGQVHTLLVANSASSRFSVVDIINFFEDWVRRQRFVVHVIGIMQFVDESGFSIVIPDEGLETPVPIRSNKE